MADTQATAAAKTAATPPATKPPEAAKPATSSGSSKSYKVGLAFTFNDKNRAKDSTFDPKKEGMDDATVRVNVRGGLLLEQ